MIGRDTESTEKNDKVSAHSDFAAQNRARKSHNFNMVKLVVRLCLHVPGGKYTNAGEVVAESQPWPQRPPEEIASLIATVSSVTPKYLLVVVLDQFRNIRLYHRHGHQSP